MANLSTYAKNLIVNNLFRNATPTTVPAPFLALYTTSPGDDNSGTELSGGAYVRRAVTFVDPTDGVTNNSAEISFPVATANWGTVTHIGVFDAITGGNLLAHNALVASKVINSADQLIFSAADLDLSLA